MRALLATVGLMIFSLTAFAETTIRQPVDPAPSDNYGGKLVCATNWVMFVSDDPDDSGTITVDGFSTFRANQLIMVPQTSQFTLQQGRQTATFDIILDPLMRDRRQIGLTYCRLRMPANTLQQ